MANFHVEVSWNAPFPKKNNYRQEGSNFGTAASRAVREWRKEQKGKRIKEVTIKVIKL